MKSILLVVMACAIAVPAIAFADPSLRARSVFVEGESFVPAGPGWVTMDGWGDDYYGATSGDAVLSDSSVRGEAVRDVVVPETATFAVWVRYLKIGNDPGTFGLRIAQNGATGFDHLYRTHPLGHDWTPTWEHFTGSLRAGPATLTLYLGSAGTRNHVDCVLITPNLNYEPDYHDFAPQTFVRFRLTRPSVPARAALRVYVKRPPFANSAPGAITAEGLARAGKPVGPGDWSPWVELSRYMDSGRWQSTLEFRFSSEGHPLPHVSVDWQLGAEPIPGTAIWLHDDIDGEVSSLIVPGDLKRYPEVVTLASSLSERHYRDVAALHLPPMVEAQIPLETFVSGWDDSYRSEHVLGLEMGAAHLLGLNSFDNVAGERNRVAVSIGVHRGFFSDWLPDQLTRCPTAEANYKIADEHFAARARAILAADPDAFARNYRNFLADELSTSNLAHLASCSSCRAGFVKYLTARNFRPTDFGQRSWDGVKPIPRRDAVDTATRKLHYWSIQYRDYTNAMMVKLASDACRRHYGSDMLTMVNFSDEPINGWSQGLTSGPDWFLYGHLASTTGLWSEDGASLGPEVTGLVVDMLRAAARPQRLTVGAYIIANTPGIIPQRAWSALMHGAKMLNFYTWGPYYAFSDGSLSDNEPLQRAVGDAARAIAKIDPFLVPARVQRAEVALLWGKSHEIWQDDSDVSSERRAIYVACLQSHTPIDMMSEEDIADGLLKDYGVLYLTESNVTRKAADAIVDWVKAGGVLQMSPGAGMRDEYNEPMRALVDLAGATVSHVDKPRLDGREHQGIPHTPSHGEVRLPQTRFWPAATFPLLGYHEDSVAQGANVLATFASGKPAVYLHHVGAGFVLRFEFMPGMGYWKSAKNVSAVAPMTGYDAREREVITAGLKIAHIVSPLSVSEPLVEAQLLKGPQRDVVMLANWSGQPIELLRVTIRGAARTTNVASSGGATLEVTRDGSDLLVTTRLADVDALILRR